MLLSSMTFFKVAARSEDPKRQEAYRAGPGGRTLVDAAREHAPVRPQLLPEARRRFARKPAGPNGSAATTRSRDNEFERF
jgi:hypothetical protein